MKINFDCPHCKSTIAQESEISGDRAECPVCHEIVLIPAPGIEIGMELGGFRIDQRLGVGGMGEVFEATQLAMNRRVALKVLPPGVSSHPARLARFVHEVEMAAKLEHPNIVTAFYAGSGNGYYYLAMSFVEGVTVDACLKKGPLKEKEALEICQKVASALHYAWSKFNMLHRDIKPANIMIANDGEVKLMDMGIAKTVSEDSNITTHGALVGTPYYISPEQALANIELDCRSDIYSLGAALYHMVTGARPFEGPNAMSVIAKHLSESPEPPSVRNPSLSPGCNDLVLHMMARNREQRPETWVRLMEELNYVYSRRRMGTQQPVGGVPSIVVAPGMSIKTAAEITPTPPKFTKSIDVMPNLATVKFKKPPGAPAAAAAEPEASSPAPTPAADAQPVTPAPVPAAAPVAEAMSEPAAEPVAEPWPAPGESGSLRALAAAASAEQLREPVFAPVPGAGARPAPPPAPAPAAKVAPVAAIPPAPPPAPAKAAPVAATPPAPPPAPARAAAPASPAPAAQAAPVAAAPAKAPAPAIPAAGAPRAAPAAAAAAAPGSAPRASLGPLPDPAVNYVGTLRLLRRAKPGPDAKPSSKTAGIKAAVEHQPLSNPQAAQRSPVAKPGGARPAAAAPPVPADGGLMRLQPKAPPAAKPAPAAGAAPARVGPPTPPPAVPSAARSITPIALAAAHQPSGRRRRPRLVVRWEVLMATVLAVAVVVALALYLRPWLQAGGGSGAGNVWRMLFADETTTIGQQNALNHRRRPPPPPPAPAPAPAPVPVPPPEPPRSALPAAEGALVKAYTAARAYAAQHPEDIAGIRSRYQLTLELLRGTDYEALIREELDRLERVFGPPPARDGRPPAAPAPQPPPRPAAGAEQRLD